MSVPYQNPVQSRAKLTEQRFLDALDGLLKEKSLGLLTVDEIAVCAGLTRSSFLKRFGSKKQALYVLYERYCQRASAEMNDIKLRFSQFTNLQEACKYMSERLEDLQRMEFSSNRAMHEDFQENLKINPSTKKIFLECVELMNAAYTQFSDGKVAPKEKVFSAAQLLVTINYNYVLCAMPGLPSQPHDRHTLIGEIMASVLTQ